MCVCVCGGGGCMGVIQISMSFFVQHWIGKDASCYFRNEQLNPPFSVIYFKVEVL